MVSLIPKNKGFEITITKVKLVKQNSEVNPLAKVILS